LDVVATVLTPTAISTRPTPSRDLAVELVPAGDFFLLLNFFSLSYCPFELTGSLVDAVRLSLCFFLWCRSGLSSLEEEDVVSPVAEASAETISRSWTRA
jgi:hypothetical protein